MPSFTKASLPINFLVNPEVYHMVNTLEGYVSRSLPEEGAFTTNPNLSKKVDQIGDFLQFMGNTTVFLLSEGTKQELGKLQQSLYDRAGQMLAKRLDPSTFHMTLHDLVNGPEGTPGLESKMEAVADRVKELISGWRNMLNLKMRTTWLFNMVNTSIVLGLAPADTDTAQRLDRMYETLEDVVRLGYAMTPHITMAYFLPGTYSQDQLASLRAVLKPVELEVELKMEDLVYQVFRDMNHYDTVF